MDEIIKKIYEKLQKKNLGLLIILIFLFEKLSNEEIEYLIQNITIEKISQYLDNWTYLIMTEWLNLIIIVANVFVFTVIYYLYQYLNIFFNSLLHKKKGAK